MSASTLRIGVLMPEVLGTYGDTGNALILAERARRRGIDAEVVHVGLTEEISDSLDIYTLGGGEDTGSGARGRQVPRHVGPGARPRRRPPAPGDLRLPAGSRSLV